MPRSAADSRVAGPTVEVKNGEGVRAVTIRRPPDNALSATEYAALAAAFTEATDARVVVLRGDGRTFCSGQDLTEAAGVSGSAAAEYLIRAGEAIAAVARAPMPLVTVVSGPAVGAGALLACLGDVIIMSETAWWSLPEARHGLPLGLSLLSGVLPMRVARELLASARRIPARDLAALGAVDHVVPPDRLETTVDQAVQQLRALSPEIAGWLFPLSERQARASAYLAELRGAAEDGTWDF